MRTAEELELLRVVIQVAIVGVIIGGLAYVGMRAWSKHWRLAVVTTVRQSNPVVGQELYYQHSNGGLVPVAAGSTVVRVLAVDGGLILAIDTGGGHRGARGYVYCEPSRCTPDAWRSHFAEDLEFVPLDAQWWSYASAAE